MMVLVHCMNQHLSRNLMKQKNMEGCLKKIERKGRRKRHKVNLIK